MSSALLQTTYFGPVQWYQKLYRYDHCTIEQYDSFQKQTYRNRCVISTANGLQALTVPVEHSDEKTTTNGDECIGMPYKVHTARVRSLSIMLTIYIPSLSRNTPF